jgi:hypothetical protein
VLTFVVDGTPLNRAPFSKTGPGRKPAPGPGPFSWRRSSRFALDLGFVVQDRIQQRTVDFNFSVVADEAKLAEFVHEEADAGSGRADHFGQGFLADIGNDGLRTPLLAEIRQQKQQPS